MTSNLFKQIRLEEGEVLHAYPDNLGYLTIGVGRLIDKRKGGGISKEESDFLLTNDIREKMNKLNKALPWIENLSDARQAVLIGMAFQMGVEGLLKFKNTLAKIQAGDFEGAAKGMLDSLWAKQTPVRANRMARQMVTGEWQFKS